ncbi:twin-arginine translocation signal domain-containing protein [Bradyrhizobium sp. 13971]
MRKHPGLSRRDMLKGSGAVLAGAALSTRAMAAAPPAEPVTPMLIEAARTRAGRLLHVDRSAGCREAAKGI